MRLCGGFLAAVCLSASAMAQDQGFVVIYHNEPAYSNILRFPAGVRDTIRSRLQGQPELVDWSAFKADPQRYLAPLVIKNEYPGRNLGKEVIEIIELGLGVTVTWNGGIAMSRKDSELAAASYALFRQNPAEYERTRSTRDPGSEGLARLRPGPPQGPWWSCEMNYECRGADCTGSWPKPPASTAEQEQRLKAFVRRFSPRPAEPDEAEKFSRNDLVRAFGQPRRTSAAKTRRVPQDPSDKPYIAVLTTWEFSGFRIVTEADEAKPDVMWLERGEAFDASASLGHGVGIGQSIEQWVGRFGRPACKKEAVPSELAYEAEDTAGYEMMLFVDGAGKVVRMTWTIPPGH